MSKHNDAMAMLLQAVNDIKKTGFTPDSVDPDFYLGGDLGIDSREMLEIWYELEQRLGIQVPEADKRNRYTLQDVADVLSVQLGNLAVPA
jgi:acyl carrier protein